MPSSHVVQTVLIARTAAIATILVFTILVSSAYLRLTAPASCAVDTACEIAAQEEAGPEPTKRRIARIAHRLSASTVAVLALLIAFIVWSGRGVRALHNRILSAALVVVTLFLAILGAATRSSYAPAVTLGNMLGSNLLAGIFWWMWLQCRARPTSKSTDGTRTSPIWPLTALVLALAHIISIALGYGASLPLSVALIHNALATIFFLASLWWFSRSLSPIP